MKYNQITNFFLLGKEKEKEIPVWNNQGRRKSVEVEPK